MSSLHNFIFDPFGPSAQTPPPQQTFSPYRREFSMAENRPRYSQSKGLPWLTSYLPEKSVNDSALLDRPASWMYHPSLGIIHDAACITCTQYQEHVLKAMNNNDFSMAEAVKSRADSFNASFMNGYNLGRRQPSVESGSHISNFGMVDQLKDIIKKLEQCEDDNILLRRDLQITKHRLANSQDDLKHSKGSPSAQSSPPSSISTGGSTSSNSCESEDLLAPNTSALTFSSMASFPVKPEPHDPHARVVILPDARTSVPAGTNTPSSPPRQTYASVVSALPSADRTLPKDSESISTPFYSSRARLRYPRTVAELKDLMALANDETLEGSKALSIVKRVCFTAHNTPREQKTGLQKFALTYWRNPFSPSVSQSTNETAIPNPRLNDSVECWSEYLCIHPHSWPRGVRKDINGKPSFSDLTASRAVAQMRPTESGLPRNDFINQVVDMFSVTGMYRHLVERNGFHISPQKFFAPFSGPVTVDSIVQHIAKCGVTNEDATEKFEPWAKNWKEC